MSKVIEVDHIAKRYVICHELQGAYSTIVDSLTKATRRFAHRISEPFRKVKSPAKRSYEEFWALNDVSFSCEEGDRLGIIGKNGAGKSTLLKILSRIIEPTKGSVKIKGRIASLLEVGTGFHPELSGRENIYLNGAILGMGRSEIGKKFDEIVAFAEVEKFLDTPVKYYSSGMYARLGFAIAAHLDPDILIVDEVLAVGDAQFQEKCLKKMNAVSSSGRTILFVSHNTAAMLSLCNKGLFLEHGGVKVSGPIETCINAYHRNTKKASFCWEGDIGDENLRIYSVEIQHERDFFYQDESAELKISCEVKNPLGPAVFGIEIKNSRRIAVAHSYINQNPDLRQSLNTPGKYEFSVELNTALFWEGEYTIYVSYFIPGKKIILGDEITIKLPIYKTPDDPIYIDTTQMDGLLLTNQWQLTREPVLSTVLAHV